MRFQTIVANCALLLASLSVNAGQIALTFDDAPLPGSALVGAKDKTERIIKALKSRKVDDALFFVTSKNIDNIESLRRLQRYTDEGFHLANHSHAHGSANKMNSRDYLADLYTSHLITQSFDGLLKFHRAPYLHQGMDQKTRTEIHQGLKDLGYKMGYVTVDNFDWYINSKTVNAHKDGKEIDFEQLRALYIDTLWDSIQFYDSIAKETLGRSPKHVLLLHENELAALFLGDLIDHIRAMGWQVISPQEAYLDPIAAQYNPSFEFTKQGRIAAIAHAKGVAKKALRHPSEDIEYLDEQFEAYKVLKEGN